MNFVNNLGVVTLSDFSEVGITDGLVGWWPLDGNANDLTENKNNGTVNGATVASGIDNLCYSFDGVNDYIPFTLTTGPTNFTISAWFKQTTDNGYGSGATAENHIIATDTGWGTGKWRLYTFSNTHLQFECVGDGGGTSAAASFIDNLWHHALVTYNGVTRNLYFDGTNVASQAKTFSINTNLNAIGRLYVTSSDIRYYKGSLDDVRIYNRALTAEEVKIQYELIKNKKMHITNENKLYIAGRLNEVY